MQILSISASLLVDTRLGLIKGILREKPELVASEQGGEPGTPACKTKIRLFSIDCKLSKDERVLVSTQNLFRM